MEEIAALLSSLFLLLQCAERASASTVVGIVKMDSCTRQAK